LKEKKLYIKEVHPVIKDEYLDYIPEDQLFSVEASQDSLIPWIKYVTQLESKKVLVFGTGGGGTLVACALNIGDGKVYGVDINKNILFTATKRAEAYGVLDKIELIYMQESYPLPFETGFFDIVILADVIEHIIDEREKYIRETFRVLKKNGIYVITGTPNLLYPKDSHTTGLFFIPWLPSKLAYKYAVFRKRWEKGKNLDYAGRRGTTYWHIKKWLNGYDYEILNLSGNFCSKYLISHNRLFNFKRKIFFLPYRIIEFITAKFFRIPITALMPYLKHLFIVKK